MFVSTNFFFFFFFFNDTATTEIYTLSLHDALPISTPQRPPSQSRPPRNHAPRFAESSRFPGGDRKSTRLNSSHSQISYAVFCLKKKKNTTNDVNSTSKLAPTRISHYRLDLYS